MLYENSVLQLITAMQFANEFPAFAQQFDADGEFSHVTDKLLPSETQHLGCAAFQYIQDNLPTFLFACDRAVVMQALEEFAKMVDEDDSAVDPFTTIIN